MMESKTENVRVKILEKLEAEETRVRSSLAADAADVEELRSAWQERDSAAERHLREVEWDQYSQLQHELSEIDDARKRLDEGLYGICEICGGRIAEKRLEAIPAARKCLSCQKQSEEEFVALSR